MYIKKITRNKVHSFKDFVNYKMKDMWNAVNYNSEYVASTAYYAKRFLYNLIKFRVSVTIYRDDDIGVSFFFKVSLEFGLVHISLHALPVLSVVCGDV